MSKYCRECEKEYNEESCCVCGFSLDDTEDYQDFEADEMMSAMINSGMLFNLIMTSESAMQRVCNG